MTLHIHYALKNAPCMNTYCATKEYDFFQYFLPKHSSKSQISFLLILLFFCWKRRHKLAIKLCIKWTIWDCLVIIILKFWANMWRREHFKLFDGSLNNHFKSIFLILCFDEKIVHSSVVNGTIMIIFIVIITHYERTEMIIFFHIWFWHKSWMGEQCSFFINKNGGK